MPLDPRVAAGICGNANPARPFPAWHTGGVGAGQIAVEVPWPPATLTAGPVNALPAYTPTGPILTLPAPTYTIVSGGQTTTADAGNGWANAADRTMMAVPVATCVYPDPWVDATAVPPPRCG